MARRGSTEQIVEFLRDQIARGELARGARLPSERTLSGHFGVSPPTVREALKALGALGLVESRHGSGTYVTASPENVAIGSLATVAQMQGVTVTEVLELLAILSVGSARFLVENADDDDLDRLRASLEVISSGTSRDEILPGVEMFLGALAAAAHRPLVSLLADFLIRVLVAFEVELFPGSPGFWRTWTGDLAGIRAEIVGAVADRQVGRLESALGSYYQNATQMLAASGIDRAITLSDARLAAQVSALHPASKVSKRP